MGTTYQSEFDALETNGQDYSSLVRASYEKLFGSLLTADREGEIPKTFEQPS